MLGSYFGWFINLLGSSLIGVNPKSGYLLTYRSFINPSSEVTVMPMAETITILKKEYEQMKTELEILRHTRIYERLLQFEQNIAKARFLST